MKHAHSIEAEEMVIGAMLLEQSLCQVLCSQMTADEFYSDAHKKIFNALVAIKDQADCSPIEEVVKHLDSTHAFGQESSRDLICRLARELPGTSNIDAYVEIVKERAGRRLTEKHAV